MSNDKSHKRFSHVRALNLKGYRPFRDFTTRLSDLEVIVGANGSGKSSLFEFLKFLRDAMYHEIPPEIVAGSIGQQIFHRPGPDRFRWSIEIELLQPKYFNETVLLVHTIDYRGEVRGPVGRTHVLFEQVRPSQAGVVRSLWIFEKGKGVSRIQGEAN